MIKFKLTFFDIFEFNKHFMKKNATLIQKYIHWVILLFFVVLMLFLLQHSAASIRSYVMVGILVVAMVFIQKAFSQFLRRKAVTAYVKQNPQIIGEREFRFDDKKLIVKIDDEDIEYPFEKFSKLDESKYHYFAYLSKDSAVIIPKRLQANYSEVAVIIEKIKEGLG